MSEPSGTEPPTIVSPPLQTPDAQPPKGALGVIFLIVFMDLMGFGIIIPLLPTYIPGYQEHAMSVTLLFSVYSACQFVGAPILGMLSDRYGRRPVLALSQVGSAIGYLLLAVAMDFPAWTLVLVYASRVIDGFSGGNISTAQAYVSDVTTPANRAKGMGVLGAAFGIGFSAGPVIGGLLGEWRVDAPAYFAAAFALLAAVLSWVYLKEGPRRAPTEAGAWLHPSQFAPIFRKPVLVQLLAISFLLMAAFVMMETTVVLYLGKAADLGGFGFSKRQTGYFFGFLGLVIIIVQGGLIGRLTKKFGEWRLATLGPVLVAIGMLLFTTTAFKPFLASVAVILLAGAANATGRSLQQPTVSSLISRFSDPREQGVVFGLYHGMGSLARVIGPIVAGLAYPFVHNTGQFILAGAIALAMGVWTGALSRRAGTPAAFEVIPTTAEATPEPT